MEAGAGAGACAGTGLALVLAAGVGAKVGRGVEVEAGRGFEIDFAIGGGGNGKGVCESATSRCSFFSLKIPAMSFAGVCTGFVLAMTKLGGAGSTGSPGELACSLPFSFSATSPCTGNFA